MIIGINTSHDSSFCLLNDEGQPEYILEEERFNRIKHSGFSTTISLEILLKQGLLDPAKVTDLVFSFEMQSDVIDRLMKKCYDNVIECFGAKTFSEISEYFHQPVECFSGTQGFGLKTDFDQLIANLKNTFAHARESSYMHHLCHAASAFYPSPFKTAAVLVLDGSGRLETTTIWHATEDELTLLHQIELPHSLGILYWLFSDYLCLEEGQTMGLAAYGNPNFRNFIYDKILEVDDRGNFRLKAPLIFWFDMDCEYAIRILEDLFGVKKRHSHAEPLTSFHADVAASIQSVTEEVLIKLAINARRLTGEKDLCLAGGVIQNCTANGHLIQQKIFDHVWIQPMANDSGTALGAALYHYYQKNPEKRSNRWRMTTPQLGLGYDSHLTESFLKRLRISYRKSETACQVAAEWISQEKVVGWFQGKAEVGPRALGGRSIVANPQHKFNVFALNEIKQRQPWRPFAPSILEEKHKEYFATDAASSYMIVSSPLIYSIRSKIPAVCHVDGSSRPQMVSSENVNPYRKLIDHFYELSDVPLVLNTSFNSKDEPIVQHPLEALRNFVLTSLDHLVLDHFIIERKPPVNPVLCEALAASRFVALYDFYLRESSNILLEHLDLTAPQARKKIHLQVILDWLDIRYRSLPPAKLKAINIFQQKDSLNLISVVPGLDKQVLASLPHDHLKNITVTVVESSLFVAQTTANNFLKILRENRQKLIHLTKGKNLFLWAKDNEMDDILHDLKLFDIHVQGLIATNEEEAKNNRRHGEILFTKKLSGKLEFYFLIVSVAIFDKFKSDLRRLGYHSGNGYLVWEL